MKEIMDADGRISLSGERADVGMALDEYFDRGYILVPGSASALPGGGNGKSSCMVELPSDFENRLKSRHEWEVQSARQKAEAERQKRIWARRKQAL